MSERKGQTRQERLKAALRENLKRRKTQARGRDAGDRDGGQEAAAEPGAASVEQSEPNSDQI